jgi:hypothetical protein
MMIRASTDIGKRLETWSIDQSDFVHGSIPTAIIAVLVDTTAAADIPVTSPQQLICLKVSICDEVLVKRTHH